MNRSSFAGRVTIGLLSIGIIASVALWLYVVIPEVGKDDVMNLTDTKLLVLILLLVLSPYILLMMFLWHFSHTRKSLLVFSFGAFLITALGVAALTDSVFIHPDAQSVMALFIVPVFQLIALILVVGICKYVKNIDKEAVEFGNKN